MSHLHPKSIRHPVYRNSNPEVFQHKVKVLKAEAASIIMRCNSPREVAHIFRDYARKIRTKVRPEDPTFPNILAACDKIEAWYDRRYSAVETSTSAVFRCARQWGEELVRHHAAPRGWVKHHVHDNTSAAHSSLSV